MINDKKLLRDGVLSVIGGMDSGTNPVLLPPTKVSMLVNAMVRGGFAETRYGFKRRVLTFENDEQQEWFEDNLFQGADFFAPNENSPMFVASVGGRIFKIDVLQDYAVTEITPQQGTSTTANFVSPPQDSSVTVSISDTSLIHIGYPIQIGDGQYEVTAKTLTTVTATNLDATAGVLIASGTPVYYLSPNSSLLSRTWMQQAETYFLIQNGSGACIIYDGATARRAVRNGLKLEVPTGTAMAYWQGRIWVAVNKKEIEAGDIYGQTGPTATTIIDFTETTYLAEGGRFRVPSGTGDITALKVLPVLDNSLGQGPLMVHTATSISTLNLPVNRERWKDIDEPVQPLALLGYGATSDRSTLPVNSDLFFRAGDGLRTFIMSRREQAGWGNTPISREMERIMRNDDGRFLQYSSATLFDNLFFFTVNPLPFSSGRTAYWRGLGVLDFDLISSMGQKSPPVYSGLWSGVNVLQITKGKFHGKERCFLFVRSSENVNEFWEIDTQSRFDNDGGRVKMTLESRSMDFGRPFTLHRLEGAEMWVDRVHGEVDFTLQYLKDQSICWQTWGTKEICAKTRQCEVDGECFEVPNLKPGYKTRKGFARPPSACEPFDERPAELGYQHQVRLEVEGHARLKALILKAIEEAEPAHASCNE